MNKKILYGFLPIFLSLVVLFAPMRAAAANDWNGPITFADDFCRIIMKQTTASYAPQTNGSNGQGINRAVVTFEGSTSNILYINGLYSESVLNGTLVVYGRLKYPAEQTNISTGVPTLRFESNTPDGVTFGGYIRSVDGAAKTLNYAIEVQFNNYYCTNDVLNIPFNVFIEEAMVFTAPSVNYVETISSSWTLDMTPVEDWAGTIEVYRDMQNNPSSDSYFAEQNQTIIDQSQTQNNLTNQQNTLIQNQTSQQHQDSQAEINQGIANSQAQINQSIQNTDEITNGYNSGVMGEAENKFESGAGDLTDIEDTLTDSSSSYVDNFTTSGFDTSFLQSVGPSLNYVVTWFTNFWNMGGALTSTYGLSFAIFIAFYILRVRG